MRQSLRSTEMLLALACAAGAAALGASELMNTFEFVPPGGEAVDVPGSAEASERHNYAMLVLAVFALGCLILGLLAQARSSEKGDRMDALRLISFFAVAVAGVVALLIFLIGDLPDVNKIGTIDDERQSFVDAKAEPQAGFWLELVGSVVLAICGIALATLHTGASEGARTEQIKDAADPATRAHSERA